MPSVLAPISSISSQYPLHPASMNQDKWGGLDQPQPVHDLSDITPSGDRSHNFDMNRSVLNVVLFIVVLIEFFLVEFFLIEFFLIKFF